MVSPPLDNMANSPPIYTRRSSSRTKKSPPGIDNSNILPESPCYKQHAPSLASPNPGTKLRAPSNRKRKASSFSKNSLDQQLHDKSVQCIRALSHLAANGLAAEESLLWLDSHPTSRNMLMSVSPTRVPAYTTDQVLQAHVGPHTQDGFLPRRTVNDGNRSLLEFVPVLSGITKSASSKKLAQARTHHFAEFVLPCIWNNYPHLSAACKSLSPGMTTPFLFRRPFSDKKRFSRIKSARIS